jgi:hypothetical protein
MDPSSPSGIGEGDVVVTGNRLDAQVRDGKGYPVFALMITDVLSRGTDLLLAGDRGPSSARSARRRRTT